MDIIDEDLVTTDYIPFLGNGTVSVSVLRLDKIHPVISGNKWFKLRFHLQKAKENNFKTIITFGGAFSNHIAATAAACNSYGFNSIGIIRGEAPKAYSHTLKAAAAAGMQLIFISREAYKNKIIPEAVNKQEHYIIPEGGYSQAGADGAATIPYNRSLFNTVCCAVGTGTMIAGLLNSKSPGTEVLGFSVLKNNTGIEAEIRKILANPNEKVSINHLFHFGGYAKYKPELITFMNTLYAQTGIPTDFVYTGKLFYGVQHLIKENYFSKGSHILIIHSGGLQGNYSLRKGTLIF
ncbi:1-aminocyclopropane-1-carboxylate deaminase/D-cysteine desulfhydrase [Niabella aquatica]